MVKIIDATGLILGRLASYVAKELLLGERIIIVNAEKAVITGRRRYLIDEYKYIKFERKSVINPHRFGPKFPRRPDGIIKRTIRGMLPRKQAKGREALKRLRVYIGVPRELKGREHEFITIPDAHVSKLKIPKYITLLELSRELGAKL